jgi:ferredoxin/flavodoxin
MNKKRAKIIYYSGTGGTARVAECFESAYKNIGYEASTQQLKKSIKDFKSEHNLLILLFAVHACNAPKAVYSWIENLEKVKNTSAVVISVSGGGDVIPNTACRVSSIKRLEGKGYKVIYENMLVMPSNWIVATKPPLAKMLLEILPKKVQGIVEDVENGVIRRTKPYVVDRFLSFVGELEKFGAKSFGKQIRVSEACTGCGWCSSNCPAGNISLEAGNLKFGNNCHLCLKCIYGCPNKALQPGVGKFIVIKEGYDLKTIEDMEALKEPVDVVGLTKGYLWSGVRKYLLEDKS